jgi:predicted transcriptional regulator of viral defense system
MILTMQQLNESLTAEGYSNIRTKIQRLIRDKKLTPVIRGIYETNTDIPGYLLASTIYSPSYISFEYALSWHNLIPERVNVYTCATFNKKKAKLHKTPFGIFTYRDIPAGAYPYEIKLCIENGYSYQLATAEKALCDQLYKLPPVKNQKELQELLYDDLRIEPEMLRKLNFKTLSELAPLYHVRNLKLLIALGGKIWNR